MLNIYCCYYRNYRFFNGADYFFGRNIYIYIHSDNTMVNILVKVINAKVT